MNTQKANTSEYECAIHIDSLTRVCGYFDTHDSPEYSLGYVCRHPDNEYINHLSGDGECSSFSCPLGPNISHLKGGDPEEIKDAKRLGVPEGGETYIELSGEIARFVEKVSTHYWCGPGSECNNIGQEKCDIPERPDFMKKPPKSGMDKEGPDPVWEWWSNKTSYLVCAMADYRHFQYCRKNKTSHNLYRIRSRVRACLYESAKKKEISYEMYNWLSQVLNPAIY